MTVDELASALYEECVASGSTAFAAKLLDQAKAALLSGKGSVSSLTTASANGKSFQRAISLSPGEVMAACRRAISRFAGGGIDADEVSSTCPDFRQLSR